MYAGRQAVGVRGDKHINGPGEVPVYRSPYGRRELCVGVGRVSQESNDARQVLSPFPNKMMIDHPSEGLVKFGQGEATRLSHRSHVEHHLRLQ